MANLPKKLYFLRLYPAPGRARYAKGGKYTRLAAAEENRAYAAKNGVPGRIFETDTNWVEMPVEHKPLPRTQYGERTNGPQYCNCGESVLDCPELGPQTTLNPYLPF
jgi:hypothetical protein